MRITKSQLRKIILEEYHGVISEDRDPLKDILDHVDPTDVKHASHHAWEGGADRGTEAENLIMPIDRTKILTDDETLTVRDDSMTSIVGESCGEVQEGPDLNSDGFLTPEELYAHFDLDGDGLVSIEDYVAHIRWHCENPDAFSKEHLGADIPDNVMHFVLDNLGLIGETGMDELSY
tara:strand:- start:55 stop:585 length:531 start_codon:yes stop_codon:yes gene_type:complete